MPVHDPANVSHFGAAGRGGGDDWDLNRLLAHEAASEPPATHAHFARSASLAAAHAHAPPDAHDEAVEYDL